MGKPFMHFATGIFFQLLPNAAHEEHGKCKSKPRAERVQKRKAEVHGDAHSHAADDLGDVIDEQQFRNA